MSRVEFSGRKTKCHEHLHRILEGMGFQVADNVKFGKYECDTVIAEITKPIFAVEADGKPYHTFKKKDQKRDAELAQKYGVLVLRVPDTLLDGKHDAEVIEMVKEFLKHER